MPCGERLEKDTQTQESLDVVLAMGGAEKQDGQDWLEIKPLKVRMVRLRGVVGEA